MIGKRREEAGGGWEEGRKGWEEAGEEREGGREGAGDGGLHEVLNGLWSRPDWEEIRHSFHIGLVGSW
jgi:hypothetical protein